MKFLKNHSEHEPEPSAFNSGDTYISLSSDRTLIFSEEFNSVSCTQLCAMLLYLDSISKDIITIYINSPGGDASCLINVYDVINMIESPVRTVCMSMAASAGAVLLAAGTPGERYAAENSEIMIHGIQFIFPLPGDSLTESSQKLEFLKQNNQNVMKMLSKHTGRTLQEIKSDCREDKYFKAHEALKYGLIDHVI